MKLKIVKSISALAASSLLVGSATAASLSFDGGTGNWDKSTTNWNGGTAAFSDGDDVTFGGAAGTVTLAAQVAPASITYSSSNNQTFVMSAGNFISGGGTLVKNGTGRMQFGNANGTTANTFTGGTTINSGVLQLEKTRNFNPLGTGDITLNGGSLHLRRADMDNTLIVTGGSIISNNGFGNIWNGGITLSSDLNAEFGLGNLTVTGVISGSGGINIFGGATNGLILNGINTYTGATTVESSFLSINGTSIYDAGALSVLNTGIVNLTNTETIGSLTLDGVVQAAGIYGATGSGASFESDFFTGTGFLNVIPEPSSVALLGLGAFALILRRRR